MIFLNNPLLSKDPQFFSANTGFCFLEWKYSSVSRGSRVAISKNFLI